MKPAKVSYFPKIRREKLKISKIRSESVSTIYTASVNSLQMIRTDVSERINAFPTHTMKYITFNKPTKHQFAELNR